MRNKKLLLMILIFTCFATIPFCEDLEKRYSLSGKTYHYQNPYSDLRRKAKSCICTFTIFLDFDYGRFSYECDYYEYDEGEARDTCRHILTEEFLKKLEYVSFRIKPIPLRHPTRNAETGQAVQRWEAYIEFLK